MSETTIALLAGFIGFLLGISGLIAVRASQRRRHFLADVQEPTLPEGTAEILAALGLAYVVVDGVDGVVKASPAAYAYGLVRGHTVVHDELLEMVRSTRRNGVVEERRLELSRGQLQRGSIVLDMRVVTIADEYILLLADDQTEIVRAQSIRNDFVANVSHELKTPVGAVSLLSEAIEDAAEDQDAGLRERRIREWTARAARVAEDEGW